MINIIGKDILRFDELDSTNDFVKLNFNNLEHGTIVLSKIQSRGRGRRSNIWQSKIGNLYISILLKEDLNRLNLFRYIVESSVAITRLLKHYNIDGLIKYPNDILVNNKKISGILIESSGSTKLDYVVIGIGININQCDFVDLNSKATSIKNELGIEIDLEKVLDECVKSFNSLKECRYEDIFNEYIKYSIVINKNITYQDQEYTITNIEMDGTIVIENNINELRVAIDQISLKELYL